MFLPLSDTILFFGCRSERADFFFSHEWAPLVSDGNLILFTAFSRDQVNSDVITYSMFCVHGDNCGLWLP